MSMSIRISGLLILASTLVGCMEEAPNWGAYPAADDHITAAVSKDEATAVALAAFDGMNTRSYELFTQRWSQPMRDAISESAWLAYRDPFIAKYGAFEALEQTRMNAAETEGFVRFSMLAKFENDHVSLLHVYPVDGTEIVGAFFRDPETGETPSP